MSKTTLASIGQAITGLLTILAALPYTLGDVATIIPAEWKSTVAVTGAIATAVLKVIQGTYTQDSK